MHLVIGNQPFKQGAEGKYGPVMEYQEKVYSLDAESAAMCNEDTSEFIEDTVDGCTVTVYNATNCFDATDVVELTTYSKYRNPNIIESYELSYALAQLEDDVQVGEQPLTFYHAGVTGNAYRYGICVGHEQGLYKTIHSTLTAEQLEQQEYAITLTADFLDSDTSIAELVAASTHVTQDVIDNLNMPVAKSLLLHMGNSIMLSFGQKVEPIKGEFLLESCSRDVPLWQKKRKRKNTKRAPLINPGPQDVLMFRRLMLLRETDYTPTPPAQLTEAITKHINLLAVKGKVYG